MLSEGNVVEPTILTIPELSDDNIGSLVKVMNLTVLSIYENSYDDFQNRMHHDVWKNALKEEVDYILTTRLDNDDVLAKDTVELLQRFEFKAPYLLEIPFGYKLEIGVNPKLRKSYSILNPFISLYEKVKSDEPIKSVYAFEHDKWDSIKKS